MTSSSSHTALARGIVLSAALAGAALLVAAAPTMARPAIPAVGDPARPAEGPAWSYSGPTGPAYWASLSPDYAACGDGRLQSPIALRGAGAASGRPPALRLEHRPARLEVENNARTIEATAEDGGGIVLGGRRYELVQFHFHAASEHTVGGRRAPLELHMVHRSESGELAVLGVLVRPGGRRAPRILEEVLGAAPARPGGSAEIEARMDAGTLLPRSSRRFSYTGSLTTPPCTEGVRWTVFAQPLRVPARVIEKFTRLYAEDNRPLQPRNGRPVRLG